MKEHDKVLEVVEEQRRKPQGSSELLQELAERTKDGARLPVLLLLRPSRRFERMVARELARSRQRCDIHCWKRLGESLPAEFKPEKKGEQR